MFYDWLPYFRAGLFAGVILFANYDMWVALKETGISIVGVDNIADASFLGRALHGAFVWLYLSEIVASVVFLLAGGFNLLLQESNDDGRRKIWLVELFFIATAFVFAFFTVGFEELQNFLLSAFAP